MKAIDRLRAAVLLAAILLPGCGSDSSSSPGNLPVTSMQIGSKTYQLEIATDDTSREHGLMERDSMPRDHGMIFVFDHPGNWSFYMHHTRFPLDIVFADAQAKIISVKTMKAYDENNTWADGPAEYAIEISAGEAAANGVKPGDQLQIPQAALKK
jgi:uncharacterized membrane protein (UPF0127 family)